MTNKDVERATCGVARRVFIRRASTAIAAPAAAMAMVPDTAAVAPVDDAAARLARLEDLEAIRALTRAVGAEDVIDIAGDRRTATARVHTVIEVEEAIGPDHPLIQMAREQGGGTIRRTEPHVIAHRLVRRDGQWTLVASDVSGTTADQA